MNPPSRSNSLPPGLARRLNPVCDRYESQWVAGAVPRLEKFLGLVDEGDRPALLRELLGLDLYYRARLGENATAEEYHRRLPEFSDLISRVFSDRATSSEPQTVNIPTKLDRFEVRELLGEGAFGSVYRAFDPKLQREIALKVPKRGSFESDADKMRFVRFLSEARAAAALQHPNICPVHDVIIDGDAVYIVMAYVPGKSLSAYLRERRSPMPQKQSALIIRKLALALEAAHAKGIVHRDLKPGNILYDQERKDFVITDFGLARRIAPGEANLTRAGDILGTPAYMSPEQASGNSKETGPAGDIYSLGVILYELLTGVRPFQGSMNEILAKVRSEAPTPPSQIRPETAPRLEAICLKALAKNPAERFASMKEFAQSLTDYLKDAVSSTSTVKTESMDAVQLAEVIAALNQTETKSQRSTRQMILAGIGCLGASVVVVGLVVVLSAWLFSSQPKTVTVTLQNVTYINDVTVNYYMDSKHIETKKLKGPIQITVGEHELMAKRLEEILERQVFDVSEEDDGKVLALEDFAPDGPAPQIPKLDYALLFDSKSVVVIQSVVLEPSIPVTLEVWGTPTELQANPRFLTHSFSGIHLVSKDSKLVFRRPMRGSYLSYTASSDAVLLAGRKSHLAAVDNGQSILVYVNGKLQNSKAAPRPGLGLKGLRFGYGEQSFVGIMDEVRISKVARYNADFVPQTRFEPDADTLALYHFDQGHGPVLRDDSGNGHHGKITNAKWVRADGSDVPPRPAADCALSFQSKDRVDLPSLKLDSTAPFTLEAHVMPGEIDPGETSTIVGSTTQGVSLQLVKDKWAIQYETPGKAALEWLFPKKAIPPAGRKAHVAGLFDGSEIRLYVNGKLTRAAKVVTPVGDGAKHPFHIGALMQSFRGVIDEVRISKIARYDKDFNPAKRFESDPDTLALYHFDEGQGHVLSDSSGKGHHGRIVGAKWVKADGSALR